MLVKLLILCVVLLGSGQLAKSQFGGADETCKKVCQPWEGDRFAQNTICYRRYQNCRQDFYENYFEDKGRIFFKGTKALWNALFHVQCVDVETKEPMDGTICREICKVHEEQLEFVLLEVCAEDTYCCKAKPIPTTTPTPTPTTTTKKRFFWEDAHEFPKRNFWDDAGVVDHSESPSLEELRG